MLSTDFPGPAHFVSLAAQLRGPHVVCGYGGLSPNPRDRSQPLVRVVFRRVGADGVLGSYIRCPVALTALGQLRCGDVVDAGRRVRRYLFPQESFDVDFSPSGWRFEPARNLAAFPPGHWLEGLYPPGFMVVFDLAPTRTLWVPCLELFSRCYGASQEVNRVLATYPWPEAVERLLPAPGLPSAPERPIIRILSPFVEDDAFFLATLSHSAYAQRAAREIYSQLDVASPSQAASGVFLKVRPWFEGPAQLLVEGEWLPDARAFLVHRIVGGSRAPGPDPTVVRERDAPVTATSDASSPELGPPLSPRHAVSGPVEMTADQPPGRGAGHAELPDDEFVVLGPTRVLTVEYVERTRRARRLPRGHAPAPDRYSTGDATGQDAGVGQARIDALAVRESDGLLLDMWNGLSASAGPASQLDCVEWYTFARGFQSAGSPELLRFPLDPPPKLGCRRWVWLDPKARPPRLRRGMLVLRCVVGGRVGYLAEIQRRRDESGNERERFSGLVFTLRAERDLDGWLRGLLSDLRSARGVFAPLVGKCPGRAAVFQHPPLRSENFSELVVGKVLSEMRGLFRPQA